LPQVFVHPRAPGSQPGLSEDALSRMPRRVCTPRILDKLRTNSDGEALCVICHEEFEIGRRLLELPCEHAFCFSCGQQWLRRNGTCPICRAEVNNASDGREHRTDRRSEYAATFSHPLPQGSPLIAVRRAREQLSEWNSAIGQPLETPSSVDADTPHEISPGTRNGQIQHEHDRHLTKQATSRNAI